MGNYESQPQLMVCAATLMELKTFWREDESYDLTENSVRSEDIVYALTGVGIPLALGRILSLAQQVRPIRILNIGIAGAYPHAGFQIGDLVMADTEVYGDIGFELPNEGNHEEKKYNEVNNYEDKKEGLQSGFQSIIESPFGAGFYASRFHLDQDVRWKRSKKREVAVAAGCTVNTCTGSEHMGRLREERFNVAFESMEGAAIAQVGQQMQIPVCEVRVISNIAARRDMRLDNIRLALNSLQDHLQACRAEIGA